MSAFFISVKNQQETGGRVIAGTGKEESQYSRKLAEIQSRRRVDESFDAARNLRGGRESYNRGRGSTGGTKGVFLFEGRSKILSQGKVKPKQKKIGRDTLGKKTLATPKKAKPEGGKHAGAVRAKG